MAKAGWIGTGAILSIIWIVLVLGVAGRQLDDVGAEMAKGHVSGYRTFFVACWPIGGERYECELNDEHLLLAVIVPVIGGWSLGLVIASAFNRPRRPSSGS